VVEIPLRIEPCLPRRYPAAQMKRIGRMLLAPLPKARVDHHFHRLCGPAMTSAIRSSLFMASTTRPSTAGAPRQERLRVIPNGIDADRFALMERACDPACPLVALIGRVVPIKDIKTFIRAAALVLAEMPEVRFAILGRLTRTPIMPPIARRWSLNWGSAMPCNSPGASMWPNGCPAST